MAAQDEEKDDGFVSMEQFVEDTAKDLEHIADRMVAAAEGFRGMADKVRAMVVEVVA